MRMSEVGYTPSMQEEFKRLLTVTHPAAEDLKVLALIEAAGKSSYAARVRGAPNDEVRAILAQNGREEVGHAVRLRRVIKLMYGEDFAIPRDEDNRFVTAADAVEAVTEEILERLAQGEILGGNFYDSWASNVDHEEAAQLLRQNGAEERRHADRLRQAASLL
jgi:rubrerythrin